MFPPVLYSILVEQAELALATLNL